MICVRLLAHPRNRPHQFPIRRLIQRREPDPLAVAPAGIMPAREQRQMLLLLRQRRHHRLDGRHQFPQPLIERNERRQRKPHRRLPRALANEPQQHAVRRQARRHRDAIQTIDIAHQIAAQREHGLNALQALVLARRLFEIHLGAQPVARRRCHADQTPRRCRSETPPRAPTSLRYSSRLTTCWHGRRQRFISP